MNIHRGYPKYCLPVGSKASGGPEAPSSRGRRDVSGWLFSAAAEEEVFHLPGQILARTRIGEVESILVDQHGLVLLPGFERLFADVLVDPLAELARIDGIVEAF